MNLAGTAAIVTGGGSGLGKATAEAFAARGARVTCSTATPRRPRRSPRRSAASPRLATSPTPLRRSGAGEGGCAHGPARVLINCAGVAAAKRVVGRDGPQRLDEFETVIRVNLVGTFNMIRLFAAAASKLEPLADDERGVIVSTASVAAYEGQIGQAAYSASKGGVVAMMLPIARELAQFGIRVNAIAPGLFFTPMMLGLPQEAHDSLGRAVPFPARLGEASEYAALAVHVVENAYLNGETIRIDGALRMQPR